MKDEKFASSVTSAAIARKRQVLCWALLESRRGRKRNRKLRMRQVPPFPLWLW